MMYRVVSVMVLSILVTGCAAMLSSSDWQRFNANNPESLCEKYKDFSLVKCIADYNSYIKAKNACEISNQRYGADTATCMNNNRALWILYEDSFSYSLRKRKTFQGVDYSFDDYMEIADEWEANCIDDKNKRIACE